VGKVGYEMLAEALQHSNTNRSPNAVKAFKPQVNCGIGGATIYELRQNELINRLPGGSQCPAQSRGGMIRLTHVLMPRGAYEYAI
jgi:hypothetical protein